MHVFVSCFLPILAAQVIIPTWSMLRKVLAATSPLVSQQETAGSSPESSSAWEQETTFFLTMVSYVSDNSAAES